MRYIFRKVPALLLVLGLATAACGAQDSPDPAPGDDALADGTRTGDGLTADAEAPGDSSGPLPDGLLPDGKTPGNLALKVFGPGLCDCAPVPDGTPSDCGFQASSQVDLVVAVVGASQPEVTQLILRVSVPSEGIQEDLVVQDNPVETNGTWSVPFDAGLLPPEAGDFAVTPDEILLQVRATVIAEPGQAPVDLADTFFLTVDLVPPTIEVLDPKPDDSILQPYIGELPFSFALDDVGSGLHHLTFKVADTVLYDQSIESLDLAGKPLTGVVDLSLAGNSDAGLTVLVVDCAGNVTEALIPGTIIAEPAYAFPTAVLCNPETHEETQITRIRLHEGDADGQQLDLLATSKDAVLVSWGQDDGSYELLDTLVDDCTHFRDVAFRDLTGDGHPDLVVLCRDTDKSQWVVRLYRQSVINGQGTRGFLLHEDAVLGNDPFLMAVVDYTLDGRPDILVAHDSEEESFAMLRHTGKVQGEPDQPAHYLDEALYVTGVGDIQTFVVADLNGDSAPDILASRGKLGVVSTFLNTENTFYPMAHNTVLIGEDVPLAAAGNFDSDGATDAVVFIKNLRSLYAMPGKNDGYFEPLSLAETTTEEFGDQYVVSILGPLISDMEIPKAGRVVSTSKNSNSMVVDDFNIDGIDDIVVADNDTGLLQVFYGLGTGELAETLFINGGEAPISLQSGDLNHDAIPDLATAVKNRCQVNLFLSSEKGCSGQPGGSAPLLNSSLPDACATPGMPLWGSPAEIPMPVRREWEEGRLVPMSLVATDMNLDSYPDVAVALKGYEQGVCTTCCNPDDPPLAKENTHVITGLIGLAKPHMFMSQLRSAPVPGLKSEIAALEWGDFDGTGHRDLVLGTRTNTGSPNLPKPNFDILGGGMCQAYGCCGTPCSKCCASPDLLQANLQGVWASEQEGYSNPFLTNLQTALLDNDNLHDLILVNRATGTPGNENYAPDNVQVYTTQLAGNGLLHFELADMVTAPTTGEYPIAIATGYLDADPIRDIVVANKETQDLTLFHGTQAGPQGYLLHTPENPVHLLSVGAEPIDVSIGDVDGDGLADLVCALEEKVSVSWGIDGYDFASPLYIDDAHDGLVFRPSRVLVTDINYDGRADIAVLSEDNDRLYIYIALENRHLVGPFIFPTAKEPVDFAVADIDKNGCRDLLVANSGAGSVSILINEYCDKLE